MGNKTGYLDISTTDNGLFAKVLIVSDNYETARIWALLLRERHLETILAGSVEEALRQWAEGIPDLIIIDINAQLDGIGLSHRLREETICPVLLLTPMNNEAHILEAYQAGIDECIVKPVSPALFLAKVKAWLRRSWTMPTEGLDSFQEGDLRLDPSQRIVVTDTGVAIKLTNLEFRLLHLLMTHPNWVLGTEDIIQRVWGFYGNGSSTVLKNVVYRLRRKIEPDPDQPRYIHTEAGLGYKFQSG